MVAGAVSLVVAVAAVGCREFEVGTTVAEYVVGKEDRMAVVDL